QYPGTSSSDRYDHLTSPREAREDFLEVPANHLERPGRFDEDRFTPNRLASRVDPSTPHPQEEKSGESCQSRNPSQFGERRTEVDRDPQGWNADEIRCPVTDQYRRHDESRNGEEGRDQSDSSQGDRSRRSLGFEMSIELWNSQYQDRYRREPV